jgi:ABC-type amino acid transport substrate-binding protein
MSALPTASAGVLRVGIDDSPPPPMEMGEPGTPSFHGYEVDLLEAVAARLGLALDYRRAVWSTILAELADGAIDVICTAATHTPERERDFDYGRPYLPTALSVVVNADDGARVPRDVRGRAFAVRADTTAEEEIRARLSPTAVHTFDYNADTYDALATLTGGAVVDDRPIAHHFAAERNLKVLGDLSGTESHYAMVFAKSSPLREPIDDEVAALEREGRLDEWRRRWLS